MFFPRGRVALPLTAAKRLLQTHAQHWARAYHGTFLFKPNVETPDLEEKQSAVDLARRLALDATLQTKADGSMVWANPEGHSFLDKFARFTKEAKAQRGQLDALEARLSSREKEVQSSSLKLVELERALLAQERELESQKAKVETFLGISLRLRSLASYLKNYHRQVWLDMGGGGGGGDAREPDDVFALEGSLAADIAAFQYDAMGAVHKEAFARLYGVDVAHASKFLKYPRICECFDKFATLRSRGVNCEPHRRRFLAEVEDADAEELANLDEMGSVWGDDACSEALRFLRSALPNGRIDG